VQVLPADDPEGQRFAVALDAGGAYTEGVENLTVTTETTLRHASGLPLWEVGGGDGAVLLRRGRGRVLALADASPLTGAGLGRADNARFLANVAWRDARDGVVYFDEYHHGFRSAGGFWGYLGYHGQRLALLPLLIVVAAALWRGGVRLGPAVPTPRAEETDAVDYASSLGRLYRQAGARRRPARALVRGFLGGLTRHLRLRPNALPAEVLAAWRQADAGPALDRLQGLLRGVAGLRRGDLTDRQLLAWARAFDQFQAEVLHAR
jgi:hypothetical protein